MQSLPAPAWRVVRRPRLRLVPVAAALAAVIVCAGAVVLAFELGAGEHHAASRHAAAAKPPPVALIHGNALQSAHCTDWLRGDDAQRAAIVTAMKDDVGGATGFGPAATLPADRARQMLTNACSQPIAAHWLLYELYIRASGFQSVRP